MNPVMTLTASIVGYLAIGFAISMVHVHRVGKKWATHDHRVGLRSNDFVEIIGWIFMWPIAILVLFILRPVGDMVQYWGSWFYNSIYTAGRDAGKPPTGTHPTAKEVNRDSHDSKEI